MAKLVGDAAVFVLVGLLTFLAIAGGVLVLFIWHAVRARHPDTYSSLGSIATISGGFRWTRFLWSDRPRSFKDPQLLRLTLAYRLITVVYLPVFAVLIAGLLYVVLSVAETR